MFKIDMGEINLMDISHSTNASSSDLSGAYTVIRRFEKGSTGPQLIENAKDGKKYVLKFSDTTSWRRVNRRSIEEKNAHAANEYLTFKLYKAAGCNTPDIVALVKGSDDKVGVLESFIEGETLAKILDSRERTYNADIAYKVKEDTFPLLQNDLLIHALLGNWDITNNENIMIRKNDKGEYEPVVIDCGGTLFFRAQGAFKEDFEFAKDVSNIGSIITFSASPFRKPYKSLLEYKKSIDEIENSPNINDRRLQSKYKELESIKTPELISRLCSTWNKEKGEAIIAELDIQRPIVESYYTAFGKSYDELKRILTERIKFINDYCTSNESGGSGASASASSGGKRRKTRKHKRRAKKTHKRHSRR